VPIENFSKSNARLRSGDFCFVGRADGRAAILVYLYPQGRSRSYFFGALAVDVLNIPNPDLIPSCIQPP
jgi:hypothetical protein